MTVTPDVIVCAITVTATFAIACTTNYHNNKLKFFDAYFREKVDAYNLFFNVALSKQVNNEEFFSALFRAKMFCSKELINELEQLSVNFIIFCDKDKFTVEQRIKSQEKVMRCLELFRTDIQNCRKFRF